MDDNVRVLLRFAKKEIQKYREQLSDTHPYHGIQEVDTIGDLKELMDEVEEEECKIWI